MHSFHSCLSHGVWSTYRREPVLTAAVRERLFPYLGGIARDHEMKALAVGGVADHVHILLSLSATISVAKAMQLLKGNSSKWLRETFPLLAQSDSIWQQGYAAFSISISGVDDTTRYIRSQEEHHRKIGFREEVEAFLHKHGIALTPKMLE